MVQAMSAIDQPCLYCSHDLQIGESTTGMMGTCEPAIRIGMVCFWCGSLNKPVHDLPERQEG